MKRQYIRHKYPEVWKGIDRIDHAQSVLSNTICTRGNNTANKKCACFNCWKLWKGFSLVWKPKPKPRPSVSSPWSLQRAAAVSEALARAKK